MGALEWGEDGPPDEVSSDGLNRFLFNEDTVDQVLATLMEKCHKVADGDLHRAGHPHPVADLRDLLHAGG